MENKPILLPLRFMARRLRVPAKWLRAEALAGRVPHLNAAGQLLFNAATVEAALSARFPRPDIALGGKVRYWKRETIERWIAAQVEGGAK